MKRNNNDAALLLKSSLSMNNSNRSSIIEALAQTEKMLSDNITPELRSLYEIRFTKLVIALNESLKKLGCSNNKA